MSGEFVLRAHLSPTRYYPTRYYWLYHELSYRTYTLDLDYALRVSETRAQEILARGDVIALEIVSLEVARVLVDLDQ